MNSIRLPWLLHAAVWIVMFMSPQMFMNHGEGLAPQHLVRICVMGLSLMVVFYINYLWLAPKHFAKGNKRVYWIVNTLVVVTLGLGLHFWMESSRPVEPGPGHGPGHGPELMPTLLFMLRNMFNLAIAAAIATTIQLSMLWQQSETARREAEAARTNAELLNLRAQVNPHFLLNTLNNIYALIEFAPKRAQEAVLELAKLLRHVLYNNDQKYVSLENEIQFISNYVNLMKIRVSKNVDVRVETRIPKPCNVRVAPLIFMSLIENAFKHGVSATQPSYIHILIEADDSKIMCCIKNSNYPKDDNDRSGHGIGLQQVASRLEIMYPKQYEWVRGVSEDQKEYSSKITIYDTKLCNN